MEFVVAVPVVDATPGELATHFGVGTYSDAGLTLNASWVVENRLVTIKIRENSRHSSSISYRH